MSHHSLDGYRTADRAYSYLVTALYLQSFSQRMTHFDERLLHQLIQPCNITCDSTTAPMLCQTRGRKYDRIFISSTDFLNFRHTRIYYYRIKLSICITLMQNIFYWAFNWLIELRQRTIYRCVGMVTCSTISI